MKGRNFFDFLDTKKEGQVIQIPIDEISPSKYQPRLTFDDEGLQELAKSIAENGLIQPITVRKLDSGYEIIAGERRYRACKLLNKEVVPCYILNAQEDQAAQMALVENIQRENLTAIEEAKAYLLMLRQTKMTQDEVAQKVGKSQSSVANKLRLLNLPDEIQDAVLDKKLTERHARALLTVEAEKQMKAFHHIVEKDLNVRETENYIETLVTPKQKKKKTKGFTRNIQIGLNSIQQCIKMLDKMGIQVESKINEKEDCVEVQIVLPKE